MKQSILIIEENAAMQYLLTVVLSEKYKVIAHDNCFRAINELKNGDIRLILVNISNLNSKNFELLLHLNSSSFYSNIPVIVLSNNSSNDLRLKCLELGVEAFFLKPFDPLGLMDCIKDVLFISENTRRMSDDLHNSWIVINETPGFNNAISKD